MGQIGAMIQNCGQFMGLPRIAVDSIGNIHTGEISYGERMQRFHPHSKGKKIQSLQIQASELEALASSVTG